MPLDGTVAMMRLMDRIREQIGEDAIVLNDLWDGGSPPWRRWRHR